MQICLTPIGVIHSPFAKPSETPIQPVRSTAEGWVEVYPEYAEGLQDIQEFSHLILIYSLHQAKKVQLLVKPFLDDEEHGVFSTRHPFRPNHIGISTVELLERQGNRLKVLSIDVLDGTPLLDIKPYVLDFDARSGVHSGWYEHRAKP